LPIIWKIIMYDIADDASDFEMLNVEIALANRPKTAIEFTGKCHYCEEPISKGSFSKKSMVKIIRRGKAG